ncbi:MAG: hypothetical protein PVJ57_10360 [Phycisphaerae bacterium]
MNREALANAVRFAAKELGKEGAVGPGAIELVAVSLRDGLADVAAAIRDLAEANRANLGDVADMLRCLIEAQGTDHERR